MINDDKTNTKENKPKNFYSVNLTEGRVFIIFVAIILFIAVVFFGVFIFISQTNKSKAPVAENTTIPERSDYALYNLSGENSSLSKISDQTSDNTVKEEGTTKTPAIEEKSVSPKKENMNVEIDNSEVLYSSKTKETVDKKIDSKFTEKQPVKKSKVTKKTTPVNDTKKQTAVIKKEDKKSTVAIKSQQALTKKYSIQIASYNDKKTAENIADFYKKEKYPVYTSQIISNGKTFYRLRIGPFSEKEKADKFLATLKESKYGKNSYISVVMAK
jgi:cell division septation protein DedD